MDFIPVRTRCKILWTSFQYGSVTAMSIPRRSLCMWVMSSQDTSVWWVHAKEAEFFQQRDPGGVLVYLYCSVTDNYGTNQSATVGLRRKECRKAWDSRYERESNHTAGSDRREKKWPRDARRAPPAPLVLVLAVYELLYTTCTVSLKDIDLPSLVDMG